MRITRSYLEKIFRSREICSKLKEAGSFTEETARESGFQVNKEPEQKKYLFSGIMKGDHSSLFNSDFSEEEFDACLTDPTVGTEGYPIIKVHFHPGNYGPIVPSIGFDEEGKPDGDLSSINYDRYFYRDILGYDIKEIMGIAKIRGPTRIEVLLLQETSDSPLGYGQMAEVEDALKPFQESDQQLPALESYALSKQVERAIKNTNHYATFLLRYLRCRPLREDLENLVAFEFDERPFRNSPSVGNLDS